MRTEFGDALTATLIWSSVVVPGACAGARSADEWETSVDTLRGGLIHVVHTPPDVIVPTFRLVEELRIGSVDGSEASSFGQIRGVTALSDGRIAALDWQAQEVRLFSPDGAHLATFGGRGEGPGELTGAWGLMRSPDDDLWVPDHSLDRMSVFDPDGGFVDSYRFPVFRYGFIWEGAMGYDGRVFKPSILIQPPRPNVLRVYGEGMEPVDSLRLPDDPDVDADDPPNAFVWAAPGGVPSGGMQVPFYPGGRQVIDGNGWIWSTESGDASYRVKHWEAGGDTALVLETRRPPVAVPGTVRDSVADVVIDYLRENGAGRPDLSKIPTVYPAVERFFLSEEGDVWVRTPAPGAARTYDLYSAEGEYRGTVATELPIWRYGIPHVRGDLMWAIVTDELDVPYVVRARIVPVS